jgi:hypothetical protein
MPWSPLRSDADLQFPERHVGCTGFPADSHDTIWMLVNDKIKNHRCPECGCGKFLSFPPSCTLSPYSTLATFIASQNTDVQSTSSTSKVTQMPPTTTTRLISRCRDVSRIQGGGGVRASLINIYLSVCENHEKNTLLSNVFGLLTLEPTCHPR